MTSHHGTVSPAAKGDTGRVEAHWQASRGKELPPRPGTTNTAAATWGVRMTLATKARASGWAYEA